MSTNLASISVATGTAISTPALGSPTVDLSAQSLSVAQLRQSAAKLLPAIGAGAAERERNRELPYAQVRQIAAARLLTFRIPTNYGGSGSTVRDVMQFIVDLAAADSNVAQSLRPSFSSIEGLLVRDSESERQRWFARFLGGEVLGNAGWEVGGANGAVAARIVREGDHFRANGSKYYSTGSLYADWVSAVALDEDDKPVSFILPRDREGLVLLDDFDAMGQRLTASGTTRLDNVLIHASEIRERVVEEGKRSIVTPFLQLYLGAVLAGIARNALNDAVIFARDVARPIKHSSANRSVDDPYVEHAVGEIAARAYSAEGVILRAADTIDAAWAADRDEAAVTRAAVEVAQAQFIAADCAIKAAELVFDVGGASTTARKYNLDRHWRNARTVANHNPRSWKAAAVGSYALKGTPPPTSGLF